MWGLFILYVLIDGIIVLGQYDGIKMNHLLFDQSQFKFMEKFTFTFLFDILVQILKLKPARQISEARTKTLSRRAQITLARSAAPIKTSPPIVSAFWPFFGAFAELARRWAGRRFWPLPTR